MAEQIDVRNMVGMLTEQRYLYRSKRNYVHGHFDLMSVIYEGLLDKNIGDTKSGILQNGMQDGYDALLRVTSD